MARIIIHKFKSLFCEPVLARENMKVLLTGSSGFIGQRLVPYLIKQKEIFLKIAVRNRDCNEINEESNSRITFFSIRNISAYTCWHDALVGCNVIIHAAARVHIMKEYVSDPLLEFREVNVDGTLNLANQAAKAGVRRFIYISSAKVNGEYTQPNLPFGPEHTAKPEDPYSISKYEAEQGLMLLAKKYKMEVVIIRPPLVYGPGVKGNFLHMMHLLQKGLPLPLGALKKNKRSFISVDNLCDFIMSCVSHPNAANQIFLVSDDEDLSTTDLLLRLQILLGARAPLLPIPYWLLTPIARLLGKEPEITRLGGSLQVDISKSRELLNWTPIETVDTALRKAVQDYMHTLKSVID